MQGHVSVPRIPFPFAKRGLHSLRPPYPCAQTRASRLALRPQDHPLTLGGLGKECFGQALLDPSSAQQRESHEPCGVKEGPSGGLRVSIHQNGSQV